MQRDKIPSLELIVWFASNHTKFHLITLSVDGRNTYCQNSSWSMGDVWVSD
ncbi:hypothetical protein XCR1_1400001 [Xenorhabdus cabanillasii JM26]|uniref:Uncharacterized protein n=1 Tax=Xenorhabdus cabanillasii JM26 TaxID=1427517 RepID=W1ISE8_9GAMM|nr:hypothetical protein XCR1_1400001 [Xenorhabdus cabanillasii JM26]